MVLSITFKNINLWWNNVVLAKKAKRKLPKNGSLQENGKAHGCSPVGIPHRKLGVGRPTGEHPWAYLKDY